MAICVLGKRNGTVEAVNRIGKYEILGHLGSGGSAKVYRARDAAVDRHVAIKIVDISGDPQMIARFRSEAATTARLRHKNIVTVYDYGEHEGNPFIVMEFLEGDTLASVIANAAAGQLSLSILDRLQILAQVADGLDYAHSQRVIHRDIKPANIVRQPDGVVKIVDFGIALALGDANLRRTRHGDAAGTVLYMAPEQFRGVEADKLTDLFSYGVVCYELLTGEHPFIAEDSANIIYRIANSEPPPLSGKRPDCPERLEAIVRQAMKKNRLLRYHTAADIALDLQELITSLRVDEARILFERAKTEAENGDFEAARTLSRRALEHDPANPEIRKFRDQIHDAMQRAAKESAVEDLLLQAEILMAQRRYNEAIEVLEEALRSGDTSTQIVGKLLEARQKQQSRREAALLIASAREEVAASRLDTASELLERAAGIDPENPDMLAVRAQLESSIQALERNRRIAEAIAEADGFRAAEQFEQALSALKELEDREGAAPEIDAARHRIEADQQAWHARKAAEQYRERLQSATATFADPELSAMQLQDLYDAVSAAAAAYPDDPQGQTVLAQIKRRLDERIVADAIARAVAAAEENRQAGDLEAALTVLDQAIAQFGEHQSLVEMREAVNSELERKRIEERISDIVAKAEDLIGREQWSDALALLEPAAQEFPGEARLSGLLSAAAAGRAEFNKRVLISRAVAEAEELERSHRWLEAMQSIDACLDQYPDEVDVLAARERMQVGFEAEERRVSELTSSIDAAIQDQECLAAVVSANTARLELPHRMDVLELSAKAWRALRKSELRRAVADATSYLKKGDLDLAEQYLALVETIFPDEKSLQIVRAALERRRSSQSDLNARFAHSGGAGSTGTSGSNSATSLVGRSEGAKAGGGDENQH